MTRKEYLDFGKDTQYVLNYNSLVYHKTSEGSLFIECLFSPFWSKKDLEAVCMNVYEFLLFKLRGLG